MSLKRKGAEVTCDLCGKMQVVYDPDEAPFKWWSARWLYGGRVIGGGSIDVCDTCFTPEWMKPKPNVIKKLLSTINRWSE